MFESDGIFLYIIHFLVHTGVIWMKIKENDKCCELQVHVDNRFSSVNQPNATTNNHQKTSSEGTGCDHDASGEKQVRQKGEEMQLLSALPDQKDLYWYYWC